MVSFVSILSKVSKFLLPKEEVFFELLEESVRCMHKSGRLLAQIGTSPDNELSALISFLKDAEHAGDAAIRKVGEQLVLSFITPFDRGDILELAQAIEYVTNSCSSAGQLVHAHAMQTLPVGASQLTDLVGAAVDKLSQAVHMLREPGRAQEMATLCAEIKELEKKGDTIYLALSSALFSTTSNDIVSFIRDKEFLEKLEDTLDLCSRVASVLNAIRAKNA